MTKFIKMNGLGNDFVIIDTRIQEFTITPEKAKLMAYRRFGVGCDQIVILSASENADIAVKFYNSDGSESGACGNASRCVGMLIMDELQVDAVKLETRDRILEVNRAEGEEVTVNMGEPSFNWKQIPLAEDEDVLDLPVESGPLEGGGAVSMGNPHVVFFVDDIDVINLRAYAPAIENNPLFPERCNVTAAQINEDGSITSKVWERGVGKTLACGTAACATAVMAITMQLVDEEKIIVEQPGGKMTIEWHGEGYVLMTGKVSKVFEGVFADGFLK